MRINYRIAGGAAASILAAGLIFGSGYVIGQRQVSREVPSTPAPADPKKRTQLAPAPAALPAMIKAAALRDENPFAYQATYLNKRYRAVGIIDEIKGPFVPDKAPAYVRVTSGFTVVLEPWEEIELPPQEKKPRVTLYNVPQDVQLSMRPLQDIDATCVLEDWMDFRQCELNRPINPETPPGRKSWVCKHLTVVSIPKCE